MKETQIFKRGQVWYVNDNAKAVGSIQAKSRPYCIVSNDKCNAYSPVIHMAPITTQEKNSLPTHVSIFDPYRNENQTILIEQTVPKSIPDIMNIATYKYTISEDKLKEIDKALSIQFGISSSVVSLDDFEELLDMLVEQKLNQIREESDTLTDTRAEKYISKLFDKVDQGITKSHTISDISERTIVKRDDISVALLNSSKSQPVTLPSKKSTPASSRSRWTPELKAQFLTDTKTMSRESVARKYDITCSTYDTLKSKFQREIGIRSNSGRRKANPISEDRAEKIKQMQKYLDDYNVHPISEIVRMYNLPSKESAVELASQYRMMLER